MNFNFLEKGKVIKNYKELCKLADMEIKDGNSKKAQLKELERYCEYTRIGNKFVIKEVYDKPKEKEDKRINNKRKIEHYSQLKIKENEWDNIGIYYILKDKDIYIGSTTDGFRRRFRSHWRNNIDNMKHTYELLHNGGEFYILHDMTGIEDEILIRQVEQEYINYFKNYTDFNVINHMNRVTWKGKISKPKPKYKKIKVILEDYEQAIQLLKNNGLNIKI